ncbi:hypothetical protein ACVISU_000440 [Bradyrhizobium sp. USDA 4452]
MVGTRKGRQIDTSAKRAEARLRELMAQSKKIRLLPEKKPSPPDPKPQNEPATE